MIYGIVDDRSAQTTSPSYPASYPAQGVHFSGSYFGPATYLDIASLACTDNGYFSSSFWSKGLVASGNDSAFAFIADAVSAYQPSLTINTNALTFYISGSSLEWDWSPLDDTAWHHYLLSVDTNQLIGEKVAVLYIDDIIDDSEFNNYNDSSGAYIMPFNGKEFTFADDTFGDGPAADFADVWIAPGVKLHDGSATIPIATRRNFITSGARPVDPMNFPSGAILFAGDYTLFPTNQGTGGAFTLTGSLSAASTNP